MGQDWVIQKENDPDTATWMYRRDLADNNLTITATRDGKWAVTNDTDEGDDLDVDGYAEGVCVSGPFDDLDTAKVAYLLAVSAGLGY